MIDLTKPVQTRDGRRVRILCADAKGDFPIIGAVEERDGTERSVNWMRDGRYLCSGPSTSDLLNRPGKRSFWVNVYPEGGGHDTCHKTKEAADFCASSKRLACIEFTYEVPAAG
jgi:hypothetical protein